MGIFDGIKKLFGEGRLRVEFTTEDGRQGVAKANYIGDPSTFDRNQFKQRIFVETGQRVSSIDKVYFC